MGIPSRNVAQLGSWCFLESYLKLASLFPCRKGCISLFDYIHFPHGWASNKAACSGDGEVVLQAVLTLFVWGLPSVFVTLL